ncbi:MAG: DUF4101 domain-containing protein [Cyanobacteria bacterium K_DeepCast_35m_m2_023]|nr:DUF4101 domain-containing protein [Cyanobacteria bacterium K_DeepCast_35m_m2_023]
MELPIDHFRLLGVSAASDAQAALRMLQQRLDRIPETGYSEETLDARAQLLRSSADLLSDTARRARYEADLTALSSGGGTVIAALDVPGSLEVGGLVLLLEAGLPLEVYELASRSLQPPRAPALGSSREADLALVAAHAALAGAAELQELRRYEAAAQLLLQAQQLLQRMGQLPSQRQQLGESLESLTPYRVLDLLSRPLTATGERAEGLRLLADLVARRGGLEGTADLRLDRDAFQSFFKQIRSFLTVQEQVDLFSAWAEQSKAADFLATTALTASGFAQRKPERIAAALTRLEAIAQDGTETLQACLLLLLGKVEQAQDCFQRGASPELLAWATQQSPDPLAQLCAYCRDWLQRDVLPGYRDLEADPDLDAYFADRDVQLYIEQAEPRSAAPEAATAAAGTPNNPFAALASGLGLQTAAPLGLETGVSQPPSLQQPSAALDDGEPEDDAEPLAWPALRWPTLPTAGLPTRTIGLAALALGVVVGVAALLTRQPWRSPEPLPVKPVLSRPEPTKPKPTPAPRPAVPLTEAQPSDSQLRGLLDSWLTAKAAVLAGRPSSLPLAQMARDTQVQRLQAERSSDAGRGETQAIEARIDSLQVMERTPNRIVVEVQLNYSDSRLARDGSTIARTGATSLRNRYVFARDRDTWRLVAFGRSA